MVIFHSYVSLPEGKQLSQHVESVFGPPKKSCWSPTFPRLINGIDKFIEGDTEEDALWRFGIGQQKI
jgi:hypothetical protein